MLVICQQCWILLQTINKLSFFSLFSAHILTEGIVGERPLIPAYIMEYSIQQNESGMTNIEKTLQLLAAATQPITAALSPDMFTMTDIVLR
jgi:predicted component of type VI protein secretion system